jgi:phosphatidylinositol kinase/protein kinase (PI-3  family)
MAFTRTTAVMSIMGYMLGLGDRHLENINVDTTTGQSLNKKKDNSRTTYFIIILVGQCFHVDMNSLFNVNETYAVRIFF